MAVKTWGIKEAQNLLMNLHQNFRTNMNAANRENAMHLRDALVKKVTEGDPHWAPNAPLTIATKGSSKPLLDHGDLRIGFRAVLMPGSKSTFAEYFVGVPRAEKETGGISLMRIAAVHEFGARIHPKKARMLVIPASREAERMVRQHGKISNIPGLFRPRGAGGRLKNVLCISEGGNLKVLFILKKQVIIPPRPYFEPVLIQEWPKCRRRWEAAARATLQGKVYRAQLA